jgi:hypothetical protein
MAEPDAPNSLEPEDLSRLRSGISEHCKAFGTCDYESINAIVTLKRTNADFENFVAAYFKQYDLSPGRFNVLMSLYGVPNRTMTLSDLGEYLIVTRRTSPAWSMVLSKTDCFAESIIRTTGAWFWRS